MARLLPMLIAALLPLTSTGRNMLCPSPRPLPQGWTFVDSLPGECPYALAHVRMADGRGAPRWGLAWEWADSLSYCIAIVERQEAGDEIYGPQASVAVRRVVDGTPIEIARGSAPRLGSGFSLKLVSDPYSSRLYAGDEQQALIAELPPAGAGAVMAWAEKPCQCIRLTALADPAPERRMSAFASVDELMDYLAASTDPAEGLWRHIDREISQADASLGGKYLLATAKRPDGSYDIIYLGGADVNAGSWQPLAAKGAMRPTIFADEYDLQWIDANGRVLDDDCSASVTADGSLLTLRFPIFRSQLRLSRAPLAKKR